jgi:hypothetical protein
MQLTPNLLVLDRDLVDRVIGAKPITRGSRRDGAVAARRVALRSIAASHALDPDASLVLHKSTIGMWEELVKRSSSENLIRARSFFGAAPTTGALGRD